MGDPQEVPMSDPSPERMAQLRHAYRDVVTDDGKGAHRPLTDKEILWHEANPAWDPKSPRQRPRNL